MEWSRREGGGRCRQFQGRLCRALRNVGTGTDVWSLGTVFHTFYLRVSPVAWACLETTLTATKASGSQDSQPWVLTYSENPSSWSSNSFFSMSPCAGQCMRNVSLPRT